MAGYDALPPAFFPAPIRFGGAFCVLAAVASCAAGEEPGLASRDAAMDMRAAGDGAMWGPRTPDSQTWDGGLDARDGAPAAEVDWRITSLFGDPSVDEPPPPEMDGGSTAFDAEPDAAQPISRVTREAEGLIFEHRGHGARLGGTVESLVFFHRTVSGDATLTVRLRELRGCPPDEPTTFGVMLRQDAFEDGAYLSAAYSEAAGGAVLIRQFSGGFSSPLRFDAEAQVPLWLRIERRAGTVRAGYSHDGQSWRTGQEDAAWFGTEIEVGVVGAATAEGCVAVFDNLELDGK